MAPSNFDPDSRAKSPRVGQGTRVCASAQLLPGAAIAADCELCDGISIEKHVVVGDRVTVKCEVQLRGSLRVEEGVFIGQNATPKHGAFPRSKQHSTSLSKTVLRNVVWMGSNANTMPGLTVGMRASSASGGRGSAGAKHWGNRWLVARGE